MVQHRDWQEEERMQDRLYPDLQDLLNDVFANQSQPAGNNRQRRIDDLMSWMFGQYQPGQPASPDQNPQPSAPPPEPRHAAQSPPQQEHRDCHCNRRNTASSPFPFEELKELVALFMKNCGIAASKFAKFVGIFLLAMIMPKPILALAIGMTIASSMNLPFRPLFATGVFWLVLMSLGEILLPILGGFVFLRCCVMGKPFFGDGICNGRCC